MTDQGSTITRGAANETEVLERLNAVAEDDSGELRPTMAALLALGVHPQKFYPLLFVTVTSHPVADDITSMEGTPRICDGPMPLAIDSAVTHVLSLLRTHGPKASPGAEKEIPEEALREAITNAVLHRDYSTYSRSQQVRVKVYPDRVEISSPGGMKASRSVDNLAEGRPDPRNEPLVRLLSQVRNSQGRYVANNQGIGIPRMVEAMCSHGLPAPIVEDTDGEVVVTLYRSLYNPE